MPAIWEAQRRHALYYQKVLRAADRLYAKGGGTIRRGINLLNDEWANIQAGQEWAARNAETAPDAAVSCSCYSDAGAHLFNLLIHPRVRVRWLRAGLSAAKRLKDRPSEGRHLNNLGLAYAAVGELPQAIECYEQDLAITREIGNRRGEGVVLGNLGGAYFALGELDRAIEFYQQRLAKAREIGDRRGEGSALGNLGVIYKARGDIHQAIDFYNQDLVIAREIGDRDGEGAVLGNLGVAHRKLSEPLRGIEFHLQRLAIARELGDQRGEGIALFNMSLAFHDLHDRIRAVANAEAALRVFQAIDDPNAVKVQRQLLCWEKKVESRK